MDTMKSLLTTIVVLLAFGGPVTLQGQSVGGEVVVAEKGRPLTGTVVVLLDEAGTRRTSVLSDSNGRFLLRAPVPGRYRLRAERVGFRSTESPLLDVSSNRTTQHRLVAGSVPLSLEPLVATASRKGRCVVRPQPGAATAQVWEEARKVLDATRHTEQQDLRFEMVRYQRSLDPRSLLVRSERKTVTSGPAANPFVSISAEALQDSGYVRAEEDGFIYYAPDAAVLLSDAFLDGHCFRLAAGGRRAPSLIGLSFEPVRGRRQPDVRGTIWLDAATAEARFLEYYYTGLERVGIDAGGGVTFGGRLDFESLRDGRWITRRWWIRMPVLAERVTLWRGSATRGQKLAGLVEEGGVVQRVATSRGVTLSGAAVSTLVGTVFDSIRAAPLPGARVVLEGTVYAAMTDLRGRFEVSGAPAGKYAVRFSHPRLDTLGFAPRPLMVNLAEGRSDTVALVVPSLLGVRASVCADSVAHPRTAVVLGSVTNTASNSPAAGASVVISWQAEASPARNVETMTDAAGRFVVCSLPQRAKVTAVASLLESKGTPVEFRVDRPGPVEQNLYLRWYSTVATTTGGLSLGASRQPVRLIGQVLDAVTDSPIAGATVRLPGLGLARNTDQSGSFAFAEVQPGLTDLQVLSSDHISLSQQVAVGGGTLVLQLRMMPRP